MDPNEALVRLREWSTGSDTVPLNVSDAMELFAGLDEWLSKGSFLPDAWTRSFDNRRLDGPPCDTCGTFHKDCN